MKKEKMEQKHYETPWCKVVSMGSLSFLCASVNPNVADSTEEDWGHNEDIDIGEIEI